MAFAKKTFNGNYQEWLNTLKEQSDVTVFDLPEYSPVVSSIDTLEWDGEGKKAICGTVEQLDTTCSGYYETVTCLVNKTKIAYNVLYPELCELKEKIDAYNNSVDEYNNMSNLLETLLSQRNASSGSTKEVRGDN